MLFILEKQYEYQGYGKSEYDENRCPGCEASAFIVKPADCKLAYALDGKGQYGAEAVQTAAVA